MRKAIKVRKKTRTILAILAGICWGVSVSILVASVVTELISGAPWFYGRLFALMALLAAVLTLGLWFDRSRRRQPTLPVETAYELGLKAGARFGGAGGPSDGTLPPGDPR